MLTNLSELCNNKNFTDKNVGIFSIVKIINNPYQRIKQKEIELTMNNITKIFDYIINIKIDYEYSVFSLNKEITYDNKIKGGRISINLANNLNTFSNSFINKTYKLYPISNHNVTMMHRFYLVLLNLLLLKNYNEKKNLDSNDLNMKFICSLEGIILQKNIKNIKIVISIDENFTLIEMNAISRFLKTILYLDESITFKFNYHKNMEKHYIIK